METKKKTFMDRFLNFVETVGNALPDPASLFIILALITLVLSAICELLPFTLVREKPSRSSLL